MEKFNMYLQCPVCGLSGFQKIFYKGDMIRKAKLDCAHEVSILLTFEGKKIIVKTEVAIDNFMNQSKNKVRRLASDKQLLYIKGLINHSKGLNVYNRFMEAQQYNWDGLTTGHAVSIISHLKEYSEFKEEWENCYEDYQSLSEEIWLAAHYDFNLSPEQSIIDFGVYYVNNHKDKENLTLKGEQQ